MDHGERLPRALGDHLAIALGDEPAIPGGVSLDAALPGASTFRWRAWKQYDFPRSGAWRETARPSACVTRSSVALRHKSSLCFLKGEWNGGPCRTICLAPYRDVAFSGPLRRHPETAMMRSGLAEIASQGTV